MPSSLFQIDTEKQLGLEFWTNVYYVAASDLANAALAADTIVSAERVFHSNRIIFTKARARTALKGDDVFTTTTYNTMGQYGAGGNHLPLFNVVRVDIGASAGRPSRKYYRTDFGQAQVFDGLFLVEYINVVRTALLDMQNTLSADAHTWNDVDGQGLTQFPSVSPTIGMRQLRRGSKRRLTPIL